ncbi:GumC family protein [Haloferula sp.]|uniref:GumC family protein n=1 Tax=Haloferula sp. TaxID=2497595 RepID=UPI003C728FF3
MKSANEKPATSGFGLHDILYVIFKHKWKIILFTFAGFFAAGLMYYKVVQNPTFESTAKVNIRYFVETLPNSDAQIRSGGLATEVEILTSRDTAIAVASEVGPEVLLPEAGRPVTAEDAAGVVSGGLTVKIPSVGRKNSSDMLYLSYRHSDPDLAVEVLEKTIDTYFIKHLNYHRSPEAFAEYAKKADIALATLRETEAEINRIKSESGVLTIGATMAEFESRRQFIRDTLGAVESELAAQTARVQELEEGIPAALPIDGTLDIAAEPDEQQLAADRLRVAALAEMQDLQDRLDMLQQKRNELLLKVKPGAPMVASLDRQIREVRQKRIELSAKYPELATRMTTRNGTQAQAPVQSLEQERAILSALTAKLKSIKEQEAGLSDEVARLSALSFKLQELDFRRTEEEQKYRLFQSSLEQAKITEALDPSKMPNIKIIQSPTPPIKSIDEESLKMIMGVAGVGLALGLGIAFLLEMVIDRKVTRPIEIETRLQLPLMMSIPLVRAKDGISKLIGREPGLELLGDAGDVILPPVPSTAAIESVNHEQEHFIVPYTSAIRDRVIFNFEVNNINHKPKLVAVTGLTAGAGTSTVAAGLAKAFAETDGRKVLLVDLNPPSSGARITSKPTDSLVKALQVSRSEGFHRSSRSLYFASAPTRRGGRTGESLAPTKLNELMPYLTASDFDYIIFDMPPVDPTSPTQAMAGLMDKVLLVLDAQKTTKERLQWGYKQLESGRADVSCVYNKAQTHAPSWVEGAA